MAFDKVDTWEVERSSAIVLPRWLTNRRASNSAAFLLSLVVDAALVGALILAGRTGVETVVSAAPAINAFDLPSPAQSAAGAAQKASLPSEAAPAQIDVAKPTPVKTEWSVTTLPPVPAPPSPTPAAPAVIGSAPAPTGAAASGIASSAGYDPYAFASYRAPNAIDKAAAEEKTASHPTPDALLKLTALLRKHMHLHMTGVRMLFVIGAEGQVIRAEFVQHMPVGASGQLASIAHGFQLAAPDPSRFDGETMTVTLDL